MLWRYPESSVLTFTRITPVPFNTTEDPEISTADLGDRLKVPCSLEYWDELQHAFVPYREFSLSESSACELTLPSLTLTNEQKDLVTSDLWRIVLNNNPDGGDEQSSDSESGSQQGSSGSQLLPCDQLVSPRRWQLVPVSTPASPPGPCPPWACLSPWHRYNCTSTTTWTSWAQRRHVDSAPSCRTGSCPRSKSTWSSGHRSRGCSSASGAAAVTSAPPGSARRSSSPPSWTADCWSTGT
ncbi:intermembrane lipid transfer protein VPS13B-like [Oncorhynchus keta]|uniref:intermembrane lipid transfer protein VPS13B-like n=1 Tax=Oncorhynchus keta TaxID=8018 RepID=UPI00227D5F1A|nr:intermembrane lipid transfer protein VPS13B-like [Oncorhynchus keta]